MNYPQTLKNIYLMGIGGTGMGAFAGLLQKAGYHVRGSDQKVYSPMLEKLEEWKIPFVTPYQSQNLTPKPDLVVVGNVIRKDNVEALAMQELNLPHDSFPHALKQLFLKKAVPVVICGTHGKTTSSSLVSHTLFQAGSDPSFLIGGIPKNFNESFRLSLQNNHPPFVVEGDEYDTAYFDKQPKFLHYAAQYLLCTSLEFDHADIYKNVEEIATQFGRLFVQVPRNGLIVLNAHAHLLMDALEKVHPSARVITYGVGGDYQCLDACFDEQGISAIVAYRKRSLGSLRIPLFGRHNLANALGCYGLLHQYGLSHEAIAKGFLSFLGVQRRLDEKHHMEGLTLVDDFAHHPTAIKETIQAAIQKYPGQKIWALFEPRSATSCTNLFQSDFVEAFLKADQVLLAPLGRTLPKEKALDTAQLAKDLESRGIKAQAFLEHSALFETAAHAPSQTVLMFFSNGDFSGGIEKVALLKKNQSAKSKLPCD